MSPAGHFYFGEYNSRQELCIDGGMIKEIQKGEYEMINGLKILAGCAGLAVLFILVTGMIPEKYRETLSGPFTAVIVIGVILFFLYMMIFEPEDFHAVNENVKAMPRR